MAVLMVIPFAGFVRGAPALQNWRVVPVGRLGLQVWQGDDHLFSIDTRLVGPEGSYAGMDAMPAVEGERRVYEEEVRFTRSRWDTTVVTGPLSFRYEAFENGPRSLALRVQCSAEDAARLKGVEVTVPASDYLQGARVSAVVSGGTSRDVATLPGGGRADRVEKLLIETSDGGEVSIDFNEPTSLRCAGGALHAWPLSGQIPGGQTVVCEMTVNFPHTMRFTPANQIVDTSDWFLYRGKQDFRPGSAIGMEDWLDRPAGSHGYAQIDGNRFVFEDGMPVKFWGTNISWADMARAEDEVTRYASKLAKHGANIVRMVKFVHKHTGHDGFLFDASAVWDGIMDPDDPMEFHEPTMRRFDHMHAALKERGVYVGWCPIAFLALEEGYRDRLIDYNALKAIREAHPFWVHGGKTMYPFSTFAPDVQDLYIELITKLLNRVNTRTGLRYAEDPAIAYVEFRNEASTFFWAVDNLAAESPVYRRILSERFCAWLRERYPSEQALRDAWTLIGLHEVESLGEATIFPFPGWGRINQTPNSRRLLDSYRFLFEYQNDYHQRFVRAVRETGYRGPLVGSDWMGADWLAHLYNLASDRRVGIIDRHRYHRGMMLGHPGSGLLEAGRNVVSDRPFTLSEWAGQHVYAAEVSPIAGFIGLGVQGWDNAMQYGSMWWGIAPHVRTGIHSTTEAFYHIGQWPFIRRFLAGGGLREGEVVARRRVSMGDLYPLEDESAKDFELLGGRNWSELEEAIPREALAMGRVEVEFTDEPADEKLRIADLDRYWDREKRVIRASNDQIEWDYSGRGFFTVDAPGGQAVIGFGGGRRHSLGDVELSYDAPFANVYVVPRRRGETLADARSLLIMVLGRTADRGDVLEETAMQPLKTEERPYPGGGREGAIRHWLENPALLFEPVRATVTLKGRRNARVYALDHDGRKPADAMEIPVERTGGGVRFTLDGAKSEAVYYLVELTQR